VDQSFFTPWHAIFYSGFLAVASFLLFGLISNHAKGYPWRRSLPAGYEISLIGVFIFAFGGVGDMIWHELFGIEEGVEALFSPTHLVLGLAMGLIVSGPFRAAWQRMETKTLSWSQGWPMLLSLTFMLSLFTFFTQIAHPLVNLWGGHPFTYSNLLQEMGVISILLETGLLMGPILLTICRWRLPLGALTLVFTLNAIAMGFLYDEGNYPLAYVAAMAAAGLVTDVLRQQLHPSPQRPGALRLFALAVPIIVYTFYFLTVQLTVGVGWSIHLWLGVTILAGVTGWLLSYLLVPPRLPTEPPL
jgi:hypothetical protein